MRRGLTPSDDGTHTELRALMSTMVPMKNGSDGVEDIDQEDNDKKRDINVVKFGQSNAC